MVDGDRIYVTGGDGLVTCHRTDGGQMLLGTLQTQTTILPGGFETLLYSYDSPPLDILMQFQATTDPDDLIEECDDTDNDALDNAQCQGVPN